MRKLEVLNTEEAKELDERMSLANPFDDYNTPYVFRRQLPISPRVLDLINYRITRKSS